jgi:hypothetical protein
MKALAAAAILIMLVVGVLVSNGARDGPPSSATSTTQTYPARTVPAPRLGDEQINRQDPPDPQRQRREARAFDRRPLLNALPITLQGVTFDIGGLAADGRTTIIVADAHGIGRRRARIAFATLLRRTADRSNAYRLKVRR